MHTDLTLLNPSLTYWFRPDKNTYILGTTTYVGGRAVSDTYNVVGYSSFTLDPGQTAVNLNGTNGTFVGGSLLEGWRLKPYALLDLGVGGNFSLGKVRYRVSAWARNVFDKTYLVERYHFGAPRTYEARVTVSF